MKLVTPTVMTAGSACVISPDGSDRIPAELWAEYAALVLLEPEPELAADWVRELELGLGVRDVHRIAARQGEAAARQHLRRQATVRRQEERRRAEHLNDATRAPDLASEVQRDLKRLAAAEAEAAKARDEANDARARRDHKAHRAAVARERDAYGRIRLLRKAIDTARTRQVDARWASQAIGETEALAKARGEKLAEEQTAVSDWLRDEETGVRIMEGGLPVLGTERAKAKRANDRDPLRSLLAAGRLTTEQYDAGRDVTELYAARSETLGSQMGAIGSVGSPSCDNSRQVFAGVQRAKKLQRLGEIERAVALNARDDQGRSDPNALAMLRAVCGEGKSLSSQGEGRAFERNAKSLASALDVVAGMRPGR